MSLQHPRIRPATRNDARELVALWASLFDQDSSDSTAGWQDEARVWLERRIDATDLACFPVIDVDGRIVSTAVGTTSNGVPNPFSPRGRAVHLANVVTLPAHRGNGFGTALVKAVIEWARQVGADRVDLSATPAGQRIYQRAGFVLASAPRMKLMLEGGSGRE